MGAALRRDGRGAQAWEEKSMTDGDLARIARTTTLTLLTDWPLSKPNRDLNGDQKAAVIHGVRRHVMSSANRKSVWRRVLVPGSLLWLAEREPGMAGAYTMSIRTKYVADKLIAEPLLSDREVRARLVELGLPEADHRRRLVELGKVVFAILQRSKKAAPDEEEPSVEADDQNQADDDGERAADTAIAAYGGREMGEIVALVKRRLTAAKRWDEVLARTAKKGKKDKEGGDNAEEGQGLEMLLRQDERLEALWSLSRLERLGIDGALFGTMVTQHDYRIAAPSAVQVSHSLTVHRAFDFETLEIAKDDLEDGPQAAILLDASYASGLYATSVTIDHAQLIENVMAPARREGKSWAERMVWRRWTQASDEECELAAKLARALVVSILYASDHAMKTQTNAQVYPSYVLAETSTKGGLNLQGAFAQPVDERRTNSILSTAIERLRAYSSSFDAAYGMVDERAELIVNPLAAPAEVGSWRAQPLSSAEALADWVQARVLASRAVPEPDA